MEEIPDPWPLRHLVLRTPRLELCPDDDDGLLELVEHVYRGIHPPEEMPFGVPWTDQPREQLSRTTLQHHWRLRANCEPGTWSVQFLVRLDGAVIGVQGVSAADFAVARTVRTGSWLGMSLQGKGLGTEMRAAVLMFVFDHLGAREAHSDSWADNPASIAVSGKLGYRANGAQVEPRRGEPVEHLGFVLHPSDFQRPEWTLGLSGLAGCLPLLRG